MRKRIFMIFSLLIALVMLLTMFSGCTGSGDKDTGSQSSSSSSSSSSSNSKTSDAQKPAERVELRVEVFDRGTQGQTAVDNNYWTDWMQKEFGDPNNIDLTYVPCPRSQEVEQLNIWMAANEAPDLCLTYDVNVVYNYYKNGGLTDLTEPLNEYGANLKDYLGEEVLNFGLFNGRQYSIPARRIMVNASGSFMRKDWLDKLGLERPETTEEMYAALKAFKEENPGNVNNVVPFGLANDVQWQGRGFFEAFREECSDEEYYVNNRLFLPGYKDGVKFLNQLYNEGLISPEFPIDKDGKMLDEDIIRGVVGMYCSNYDMALRDVPGHYKNLKANISDAELVPVDPYTNKYTGKHTKQTYDPSGIKIMVPKTSKVVNEAIIYLNWMTDSDVIYFLQNGNEGVGHELIDGIPKVLQVEGEQMFPSMQNIDYTLILNGVDLGDTQKTMRANAMSYPGLEHLYEDAYNLTLRDSYVAPTLPVPTEADAKYGTILKEKENDLYGKVITAKPEDFEAVWEEQIAEYLAAGGQEVLDQRAAAWKEMR